jgi:hypothetical protein
MKRLLIGTALVLVGLAPAIGSACEYNDVTMASATPPAQLGLATAPAASKAPAPVVAKATVKEVKELGGKAPSSAPQTSLPTVVARTN